MLIGAILAGMGLASVISRRTVLGVLLGAQQIFWACAVIFVCAGALDAKHFDHSVVAGFLILLTGTFILMTGTAIALRLYYLRQRAGMEDIRALRH